MKIEELLFDTRSRNAEKMGGYYAHWEAQLYCAVITMVLRNLDVYIHLLDGRQVSTYMGSSRNVKHESRLPAHVMVEKDPKCPESGTSSDSRFCLFFFGSCSCSFLPCLAAQQL